MKKLALSLSAIAILVACADAPPPTAVGTDEGGASFSGMEIVVTPGFPAPVRAPYVPSRPSLSTIESAFFALDVNGSATTQLTLIPATCDAEVSQELEVAFMVHGSQRSPATITVNTRFEWNGTDWEASEPVEIEVPEAQGQPRRHATIVTLVKPANTPAGSATIVIVPEITTNNADNSGQRLSRGDDPDATIDVEVQTGCAPVENTPPVVSLLVKPTVEATLPDSGIVYFWAKAWDNEDGKLTDDLVCLLDDDAVIQSGDKVEIGEHTITCSVTDSGGLTTSKSKSVKVQDTTPPDFTSIPSGTIERIAANINGAEIDINSLGIDAEDWNNVSEPTTWSCNYMGVVQVAIGETITVSCTATDARGNESAPSTFDVHVGLDMSGVGFLPPLRMVSPFSAHKLNSTIPHKFPAPTYAGGIPAIDLAEGLTLVLKQVGVMPDPLSVEANEFAAGSTEWRYDPTSGHYIFNLKTDKSWPAGEWTTTVSFQGEVIATTTINLRK